MPTKTVYQTDADGVFIGETVADESPLEKGVYLIPAGCVVTPPPPFLAGHYRAWQGGVWVQIAIPEPEAPPPPPVVIPDLVSKLSLVRAMRLVALDGTPAGSGPNAWDAVKLAIAAASETAQEDWQLATHMPRHDPVILGLAGGLGVSTSTMDAVFLLADQIDRGEVTP